MERVIIIGCGGAGKSTLARKLGEKTGLPVVHLDQIFWSPGNWEHLSREEFDMLLLQELEKPTWILDGNFDRTMALRLEKCDTVIYLDYNRFICIAQWLKRVITNWEKPGQIWPPAVRNGLTRSSLDGFGISIRLTENSIMKFSPRRKRKPSTSSKTAAR